MIVNINPYDTGFDENSNVMKFSALARDVHTAAQKRPPPSAIPRLAPQTNYRKVTLSVGGGKDAKLTEKQVDIVEGREIVWVWFVAVYEQTLFVEGEDQDDEADWEPNNPLIEALFERVEELRIRVSNEYNSGRYFSLLLHSYSKLRWDAFWQNLRSEKKLFMKWKEECRRWKECTQIGCEMRLELDNTLRHI